ncbi:MAG: Zn-dependent hydrolase [Negativicutes bacterium]
MRFQSSAQRIQKDLEALAQFTATPGLGVTRFSFTDEDRQAREYIKARMLESHLMVYEDAAGTVVGHRQGQEKDAPVIMLGSHFDSVKNGGAFDGTAGVIAGLEIARILDENKISTRYPVEFIAMIEEEGSRFGSGLFGSRAMAGKVSENELKTFKDDAGISIAEAMKSVGLESDKISAAVRTPEKLKAFLELHIEQGPVLEKTGVNVGVVDTIVGIDQWEIVVQGRSDHAGTTPMDMRADALVAAADMVKTVRQLALKAGPGTVATVGKMQVHPGAGNIVPGMVVFTVDIRSSDAEKIRHISEELKNAAAALPLEYPGIVSQVIPKLSIAPIQLSATILRMMEAEARTCGISTKRMLSGAGHDAMVMAGLTEVGLIFVPSRNGRSHSSEEWTDYVQLKHGVDLLMRAVLQLAEVVP